MREVCADCSKPDPTWTSLNRGILLCQDCCSVHRSLGRHISWVRSLQQGWWSPTLLLMVEALSKAGANSVWEYTLLDKTSSSLSCKPSSSDPISSVKEEFIRNKHEESCFILRPEQDIDGAEGLGAQLHGAARTSDLLTSLRLFSQGADPNFYHEEKGSCPLHVAAKTNQALQAELLMIYGADLNKRDSAGRTPEDVARDSGHVALAERLRTARFHVIDRLLKYLCSRKAGLSGLCNLEELSLEPGEHTEGRFKLESLSNSQFEKLVADVYDEVDRREAGCAWLAGEVSASQIVDPAAFLPPHPELSATRNQARQKLARLTSRDLDQLLTDVLRDARRRDISISLGKHTSLVQSSPVPSLKLRTDISDDEPLYDSVASDEDYASVNGSESVHQPHSLSQLQPTIITNIQSQPSGVANIQSHYRDSAAAADERISLRHSLSVSEATIIRLQSEVKVLHDQVAGLLRENRELRDEVTRCRSYPRTSELTVDIETSSASDRLRGARPTSMYEARDRPRNLTGVRGGIGLPSISVWPEYNDVICKTNQVTKRIQELCASMKAMDLYVLAPSAARIRSAVTELTALFPQMTADELISELVASSRQLEIECSCTVNCPPAVQEQNLQRVRNIAYDIAKATKQLVVQSQSHSSQTH